MAERKAPKPADHRHDDTCLATNCYEAFVTAAEKRDRRQALSYDDWLAERARATR